MARKTRSFNFLNIKLILVLILVILLPIFVSTLKKLFIYKTLASDYTQVVTTTDTSYNKNVLVLKYFPLTADGQNIDINVTGDVGSSYSSIKQKTIDITNNLINLLPKATKYRGYYDILAQPALNYNVTDTKEYTQPVPTTQIGNAIRYPDYYKILMDHNICDYVSTQGVSEVWIWAYQGPNKADGHASLEISESKMSGPYGDISNSQRYNEMPKCGKTYTVLTFNYGRGSAEAVHSWGHQIEAELSEINVDLFRNKWQGPNYPQTLNTNGRCGSIHNPPNARNEYDYANPTPQQSDCQNWNPDGLGPLTNISCSNWGCSQVSDSDNPQLNFLIWNSQNLPGRNNKINYQDKPLRNFWDVHGDFDAVMSSDRTLFMPKQITLDETPVVSDDFNRADSQTGLGTASTGQTWEGLRGNMGVLNSQAAPTTCGTEFVVDSGNSDGEISLAAPINSQDGKFVFRAVDASNYYFVERKGTTYEIDKFTNGTKSLLKQNNLYVPQNGDNLKILLEGDNIRFYVNNLMLMQTTDSSFKGTKYGFGSYCATSIRYDDFNFKKFASVVIPTPNPTYTQTATPTVAPTASPTPTPIPAPLLNIEKNVFLDGRLGKKYRDYFTGTMLVDKSYTTQIVLEYSATGSPRGLTLPSSLCTNWLTYPSSTSMQVNTQCALDGTPRQKGNFIVNLTIRDKVSGLQMTKQIPIRIR